MTPQTDNTITNGVLSDFDHPERMEWFTTFLRSETSRVERVFSHVVEGRPQATTESGTAYVTFANGVQKPEMFPVDTHGVPLDWASQMEAIRMAVSQTADAVIAQIPAEPSKLLWRRLLGVSFGLREDGLHIIASCRVAIEPFAVPA